MPLHNLTDERILKFFEFDHESITELAKTVQPLVRINGHLYTIKQPDLFTESFTWSPAPIERIDTNRLSLVTAFRTYHQCGYHALFKPSIAEVLAQLPGFRTGLCNEDHFFEVLNEDELIEIHSSGEFYGHSTTTILYRQEGVPER